MKSKKFLLTLLFLISILAGQSQTTADAIYYGGDILTMEGPVAHYAEAIAVKDGLILFVGPMAEAEKLKGEKTLMNDLQGKTLLPGFFDAHSHIFSFATSLEQGNLAPPPAGKIQNMADIIAELSSLKARLKASDTSWLIGKGYDEAYLAEHRHPTAAELDKAFPNNPVILVHVSGQMIVANTAALNKRGIGAGTPDPEGGEIVRIPGSNKPAGLLMGKAQLPFRAVLRMPRTMEKDMELLGLAQDYYASCGITTANEGALLPYLVPLASHAADKKLLKLDLIVSPHFVVANDYLGTGKVQWGLYKNHLKYAGIKIVVDGATQSKTAFLTQAYLTPVAGCDHDCKGSSNIQQAEVNQLMLQCYKNKVQVFAHCNGDAATDMVIKGHEYAEKELKANNTGRRTVILHSQVMHPGQLELYKKYGLIPSFFTNQTYFWGDDHIANLGLERASNISPIKSAQALGMLYTNHTDCTVTPIDQLFLLWTAVNRLTRSGVVLGENHRIDAYNGLRAMTINAAYQYFEEKSKGSLKKGKIADLVILDKNPLKVEPMQIKEVKVMETLKAGKQIWKRE